MNTDGNIRQFADMEVAKKEGYIHELTKKEKEHVEQFPEHERESRLSQFRKSKVAEAFEGPAKRDGSFTKSKKIETKSKKKMRKSSRKRNR